MNGDDDGGGAIEGSDVGGGMMVGPTSPIDLGGEDELRKPSRHVKRQMRRKSIRKHESRKPKR